MTENSMNLDRNPGILRGRAAYREMEANRARRDGRHREADEHDELAEQLRRAADALDGRVLIPTVLNG